MRLGASASTLILAFIFYLGAPPISGKDAGSSPLAQADIKTAAGKLTPRMPDGHPDLNGFWDVPRPSRDEVDVGNATYLFGRNGLVSVLHGLAGPPADTNLPVYKPELQGKIQELRSKLRSDPAYFCKPLGVPRVGAPKQIVQTPKLMVFFYQVDFGDPNPPGNGVRLIPTDGRPHRTDTDPLYFGDSIAKWDGDTLVVDANHFTDDTWLASNGYFHSRALHVIERLTRIGDTLRYEVTVEDPNVLTTPWVETPRTLILVDDMVIEATPCREMYSQDLVN